MTFTTSEGSAIAAQCDFSWAISHSVRQKHQHATQSGISIWSDTENWPEQALLSGMIPIQAMELLLEKSHTLCEWSSKYQIFLS